MPSLNEKLKSLQGYSKQLGLKYHPDNHFGNPKQTFTGFNTDFTYYNNNSGMAFTRSVNSTLSNLNYMRYGGTINRQERYTDYDLMDAHSIISNALDIISDDIVSQDFNHEIINIKTENEDIKLALEDLFYNILDIDYNLWYWARNMLKYGDCYVLTYQEENKGIIDSISLPVNYVDRHEKIEQDGSYNIYFTFMGSRERIQNYQMMDFRIIGDERFYPFGKCLKYDTYIETPDGYKFIKDIKKDDIVYSFDELNHIKVKTKVLDTIYSGKKDIIKIKTNNHEIECSQEHNILTYNKKENKLEYKKAGELNVKDLLVINNKNNSTDIHFNVNKQLSGFNKNGWKNTLHNVPDVITEEWAQFFGFMLGDGWLNTHGGGVCISLGVYENLNQYYIDLLEKFSGKKHHLSIPYNNKVSKMKYSGAYVNSKMLKNVLLNNGFICGFNKKRVPSWIYTSPEYIKKAFIRGLVDADGSAHTDKWGCTSYQLMLSNEYLVKDVKYLLESVQIKCGNTCSIIGKPPTKFGDYVCKTRANAYHITFYDSKREQVPKHQITGAQCNDFITTPIRNIINTGKQEDVYDIYVDNRYHNFIANGIVVHNSVLEPIRRTWKQLRLLEDSMLTYRVARAPERRVFYIEVGNMDNESALSYINTIRAQLNTQPIIDANGEIDLRYSPNPIWKNSPIPLLDGRVLTIEELSKEYEQGKTNWVYSIDDDTHELLPGKITWCGKNKNTDDHLLKIWLDDNTYQIYDPSHPLIRRDGNKVLAKDLVIGDSMMPFYKGKTNTGYEMVYDPNEGSYRCTHRFVAESSLNEEKNNIFESMDKERNKNQVVVHHKDFNKYNNRPDNLKWMGFRDHFDYHSKLGIENKKYFIAWKETKEGKKKLSDTAKKTCLYTIVPYMKSEKGKLHGKKYGSTTGKQALIKYSKSEKGRQKASEKSKKWNVLLNKGKRLANSYNGTDLHKKHNEIRSKAFKNTWNTKRDYIIEKITLHYNDMSLQIIKEEIKKLNKWISVRKLASLLKENSTFITHLISLNPNYSRNIFKAIHTGAVRKIIKYGGYIDYKQLFIEIHPDISVRYFGGKKNHRIIRIESVPIDDVYCMNIVGPNNEQNRHNFAILGFNSDNSINLKSGLFIKNSLLDDFFVPTRGGNPTNKIDRLEGSDNSNAIQDIDFILKELFGGLKVPKAYLNYEDGISSRCAVPETEIPLLDGTVKTIAQLIEDYNKGIKNYVYSLDNETQNIVPGEIEWVGYTRMNTEVIRVWLDNNKYIDCTPDHRFLTRENQWIEAKDLTEGQSLMPLYLGITESPLLKNYTTVYHPGKDKFEPVHRLVAKYYNLLSRERNVVHHKDFNKKNNNPNNLDGTMDYWSHKRYHAQHQKLRWAAMPVEERTRRAEISRQNLNNTRERMKKEGRYPANKGTRKGIYRKCVVCQSEFYVLRSNMHRDRYRVCSQACKDIYYCGDKLYNYVEPIDFNLLIELAKDCQYFNELEGKLKLNRRYIFRTIEYNKLTVDEFIIKYMPLFTKNKYYANKFRKEVKYDDLIQAASKYRSIVDLYRHFNLKVEEFHKIINENCGSVLEFVNIYMPLVVENKLSYGQILKQHNKKLNHKVLKIEILEQKRDTCDITVKKYHNFATAAGVIIHNSQLASEDVRYSRTIQRYQKMLTNELYKVAYMHLLLLGFEEGELEEFSINLFNPSQVATMQKLEVLDKQMDVAGKMKDFFSEEYIYKNVFNMTDLDIKEERIKKVNEYKFEMLKKVLDSINITDIEGSLSNIATFNFDYDKLFGNSVSETAVEKIDNENTKDEEEQLDDTEGGEKKEPSKKKKVVPGMGKPELKPEKPTEKPGTETDKTVKDMAKLGDSVKFNKKALKKYLNEKDVERGIQVHSTNKKTMIKLLNKKLHELAKDDFKLDLSEHQNQEDITISDN